ncbi:MAG: hypothetical protein GC150_12475 [Rhizobiales bacterium]|nr:hypothetical protein [Hyphomicrobiales bacterium]
MQISTQTVPRISRIDWVQVRADYESGKCTIGELAERFTIPRSSIYRRRKKECWSKPEVDRPPEAGQQAPRPGIDPQGSLAVPCHDVAAPGGASNLSERRLDMVRRFYAELDRRLRRIEAHDDDPESVASERSARLLASLARTFEKLNDYLDRRGGSANQKVGAPGAGVNGDADERDAESWRHEIARRLAAAGAGGRSGAGAE